MKIVTIVNLVASLVFGGILVAVILGAYWPEIRGKLKRGKSAAIAFLFFASAATICAQKPPVVKDMNLTITRFDARGFDVAWDYGGMTPADFRDGETVRIYATLKNRDYRMLLGVYPVTVTNVHYNAVAAGLPRDWMRSDLQLTAECNNSLLFGETNHEGEGE